MSCYMSHIKAYRCYIYHIFRHFVVFLGQKTYMKYFLIVYNSTYNIKRGLNVNNLKDVREKAGFTQEELARLSEISLRYYIRVEKDASEPTVRKALKLARILGCTVEELFPV